MLRPEPVVLSNDHVRLEPLTQAHRADLAFATAADESAFAYYGPVFSKHRVDGWMEQALTELAAGSRLPFAVIDVASGKAIGSSSYIDIAPDDHRIEIGHTWYGGPWQGTKLNPAAKLLLCGHAFDLGALRVCFKCDAANQRSRRGILGTGAVFEGVLRNHSLKGDGTGNQRDSAYFSLLPDEWPAAKAHLEARLAR